MTPSGAKHPAAPPPPGAMATANATPAGPRDRGGGQSEALLRTAALQAAIFNSAHFSCIATDASGVIQIFNTGAERMLGHTAAEVVNRITPAALHDHAEVVQRATALSLAFGMPIAPGFEALVFKAARGIEDIYELTKIRKDGSRFPAVVSVTALRETALDPGLLEIEVTESVLMGDTDSARSALFGLRNLGVRLAIDDFGTGYSSLSYLSRFPVDSVKIDRSFVQGMTTAVHDVTIIAAVIAMSRSLKHCVVAEGVETAEQLVMLQGVSCDEGQGFHLGRPMDAAQFSSRLRQGPPRDAPDAVAVGR